MCQHSCGMLSTPCRVYALTNWGFSEGKSRCAEGAAIRQGVPVCRFVTNSWCTKSNIKEVARFCMPEVEYLMISCRPHYLPREISVTLSMKKWLAGQESYDLRVEAVNIKKVSRFCSPKVEYLMISCRPHYLPRIFCVAVYLPPQTDAVTKTTLNKLYKAISEQENAHPEAALMQSSPSPFKSDHNYPRQGLTFTQWATCPLEK